MRYGRLVAAAAAVLVAVAVWVTPAGAAPDPNKCKVENLSTGVKYTPDLQAAIDAALAGEVLQVKGVCVGNFTIDKDLTLKGKGTKLVPQPMLDADGSGRPLTVRDGISVVLDHLTVSGGDVDGDGGGILNSGDLALKGTSSVSGNTATGDGGGIYNAGTLTLYDSSSVTGNTAGGDGGGIYNAGTLTLYDNSQVSANTADGIAGGIFPGLGSTLNLEDFADVSGNTAGVYCPDLYQTSCDPAHSPNAIDVSVDAGLITGRTTGGFELGGYDQHTVEFRLEATDPDGHYVSIEVVDTPGTNLGSTEFVEGQFTICGANGCYRTVRFTPCADTSCFGTTHLTFTATDNQDGGVSELATATITITKYVRDIVLTVDVDPDPCTDGVLLYERPENTSPLVFQVEAWTCARDTSAIGDDTDVILDILGIDDLGVDDLLAAASLTRASPGVTVNVGSGLLYLEASGVSAGSRALIVAAAIWIHVPGGGF